MCMIVINETGKPVPRDLRESIVAQNGDGFGRVDLLNLKRRRTMRRDKALRWLASPIPGVTHCRWSTHGASDIDNCHPFLVKGWYLFHNGVVNGLQLHGKESDTACLARMLSHVSHNAIPRVLEHIASRFALVSASTGKIVRVGLWHERDGVWYSNTPTIVKRASATTAARSGKRASRAEERAWWIEQCRLDRQFNFQDWPSREGT